MTKAPTQKEMFAEVIALAKANDRQDIVEFAEGRIAVLDKKAANKKATKTQEENVALFEVIKGVLTAEGQTVTEIMAKDATLSALSNQKVSALLRLMVADGVAKKEVDKKKSLFSLA